MAGDRVGESDLLQLPPQTDRLGLSGEARGAGGGAREGRLLALVPSFWKGFLLPWALSPREAWRIRGT